jgi:hypothetical protein
MCPKMEPFGRVRKFVATMTVLLLCAPACPKQESPTSSQTAGIPVLPVSAESVALPLRLPQAEGRSDTDPPKLPGARPPIISGVSQEGGVGCDGPVGGFDGTDVPAISVCGPVGCWGVQKSSIAPEVICLRYPPYVSTCRTRNRCPTGKTCVPFAASQETADLVTASCMDLGPSKACTDPRFPNVCTCAVNLTGPGAKLNCGCRCR